MEFYGAVLVIALLGGIYAVVRRVVNGPAERVRPRHVETRYMVGGSPPEAVGSVGVYLVASGYAVLHKTDTSATLLRPRLPDSNVGFWLVVGAVVLFPLGLLFLAAYHLYFRLARPRETVSVAARYLQRGRDVPATELVVHADTVEARKDVEAAIATLPEPGATYQPLAFV